jgi:hypothetical protein
MLTGSIRQLHNPGMDWLIDASAVVNAVATIVTMIAALQKKRIFH